MLVLRDPQPGSSELAFAHRALDAGELIVVPTDTVYGIAARAEDAAAVARLYAAKGRDAVQPTAVVCASIDELHRLLPAMGVRARSVASALLPGPWTFVIENHDAALPWLTGGVVGAPIGVRVPTGALALPPLAASSANPSGLPTARDVSELHPSLHDKVACVIDAGRIGDEGASTVIDLVAWERGAGEPVVLRDDARRAPAALEVLSRIELS